MVIADTKAKLSESKQVLLTPEQLAERLAVPSSWIREKCRERARLRDSDPLPCISLGKYVRFDWNEVQAWLQRQKR
jgi:predicted DNA-binding transcriptional regulator AlpA